MQYEPTNDPTSDAPKVSLCLALAARCEELFHATQDTRRRELLLAAAADFTDWTFPSASLNLYRQEAESSGPVEFLVDHLDLLTLDPRATASSKHVRRVQPSQWPKDCGPSFRASLKVLRDEPTTAQELAGLRTWLTTPVQRFPALACGVKQVLDAPSPVALA